MFQTKFDRWLVRKFIHEHHIRVVQLPQKIGLGVKVIEQRSQSYNYTLIIKDQKKVDDILTKLRDEGCSFSTKVIDQVKWYSSFINNPKKSFSYRIFWWIVILLSGVFSLSKLKTFLESDSYFELKENVQKVLSP